MIFTQIAEMLLLSWEERETQRQETCLVFVYVTDDDSVSQSAPGN